jgi:hypothetical protein
METIMRLGQKQIVISMMMIFAVGIFGLQVFAQEKSNWVIGKKGMVTFSSTVKAGEVELKPGMYHLQHVEEGGEHVVVFKPVKMPAGYKEHQMVEQSETVRVKCKTEPVSKKLRSTKVQLVTTVSGERIIKEVQIAGETVKHTL